MIHYCSHIFSIEPLSKTDYWLGVCHCMGFLELQRTEARITKERLKSSLRKIYGRYGDLTKQYEVPLSRMLHDPLDDDHIQWHLPLIRHCTNFWPLLIWTLLQNMTFYLIVQDFHRTCAMVAAWQQRTLTPPDTWSSPTLELECVLMSRPISPERVLSPDFWISNTPRYFSFAPYKMKKSCTQRDSNSRPLDCEATTVTVRPRDPIHYR